MNDRGADRGWRHKSVAVAMMCALLGLLLPGPIAKAQKAEKRVALVIGNSAYRNTHALSNPVNDAQDVAGALRDQGFTVLLEQNLDKAGMEDAVSRFARLAQDANAALFYYAGHGMQYRGSNYLVPIDAKLEDEFKLTFELTHLDDVMFGLERARGVKILILDACRDNPLADHLIQSASSRDLAPTHGLARIEASRGMVIAYSTQANQTAIDGSGRNSPFTLALIKEIRVPGVEIGTMFRRVAADVNEVTDGQQLPELSVSLVGDFYINTHDTDVQAWAKIHNSNDARAYSNFIDQYPNSALVADAREHISHLEGLKETQLEEQRRLQAAREQAAREQAEKDALAAQPAPPAPDQIAWDLLKDSKDPDQLRRFVEQFPTSAKRPDAERRIASLQAEALKVAAANSTDPHELARALQFELKRVGCFNGAVSGEFDEPTRAAVRQFAKLSSIKMPDELNLDAIKAVRGADKRVCPLLCPTGEHTEGERCVANAAPPPAKSSGKCFSFQGRQFCE